MPLRATHVFRPTMGGAVTVTCSIGVATHGGETFETADQWLKGRRREPLRSQVGGSKLCSCTLVSRQVGRRVTCGPGCQNGVSGRPVSPTHS